MLQKSMIVAGIIASISGIQWIYDIPATPQIVSLNNTSTPIGETCVRESHLQPLDNNGVVSLLVWNVEQLGQEWLPKLKVISQQKSLTLLQDTSLTSDFTQWLKAEGHSAYYADAFSLLERSYGVMTLSKVSPLQACVYTQKEPWIQLPKSTLLTHYSLSNGQRLAVVNLHAVNYSFDLTDYKRQFNDVLQALTHHKGPMIVAGDFSSWNEERESFVKQRLYKAGLREVSYSGVSDNALETGLVLKHVFYRGLMVTQAERAEPQYLADEPSQVQFRIEHNLLEHAYQAEKVSFLWNKKMQNLK
ncbi:endonuclease/exonuclease/phosphatase family protein [Vibrio sp.]|nr:endonuclease/exonuclease/phosphatase family protein [Vibrio sp.]